MLQVGLIHRPLIHRPLIHLPLGFTSWGDSSWVCFSVREGWAESTKPWIRG